jgi:hypothetical protein
MPSNIGCPNPSPPVPHLGHYLPPYASTVERDLHFCQIDPLIGRRGGLGSLIWIDDSADLPVLYAWVDGGDG